MSRLLPAISSSLYFLFFNSQQVWDLANSFGVSLDANLKLFWPDTDGFVIPSLEIGDPNHNNSDFPSVEDPKTSVKVSARDYSIIL